MLAEKRTAVATQGIGSDGERKIGLLPSIRNPLDMSSAAQTLDGGPSSGEPAFSPWPRLLPMDEVCQSGTQLRKADDTPNEINSI
jgi:hypothetical protein